MFSTQGQEVKNGGGSKSLTPGVMKAHILSGNVRTSSKGDKKVLDLFLEGEIVPNFEGWPIDKDNPTGPKYAGPTGKVTATVYTSEFNSQVLEKNEILSKIVKISDELGLRKQIDAIGESATISSIEEWVEKAIIILRGHDLNWFLKGTEEEYNGKTIVKLSLPKFKYVAVDKTKLDIFDKTNIYHYKALAPATPVASFDAGDFEM